MGYGIGLSGLMSAAEAIDVTSNNISNAQTVGYKSGEYVFSDQFFRAQDPQSVERAGMGTYRMNIRRTGAYGTVVSSQNPLDMAITGPGMFMLAKQVDGTVPTENPTSYQFTRNGQFATDSQNRIVNENGMFLVGYPADASGKIISSAKSVLILNRSPLAQQATKNSTINLNLDNRADPVAASPFNASEPRSYSQSTSQTVYDDKGTAHTLSVYYKKIHSTDLEIIGDGSGSTFTFNPKEAIGTTLDGEQTNQIATTASPSAAGGVYQTISNAKLTYVGGGLEKLNTEINEISGISAGSGYATTTRFSSVPLVGGSGTGATADITIASNGSIESVTLVNSGTGYVTGEQLSVAPNSLGNGDGSGFTIPITAGAIGVISSVGVFAPGTGYGPDSKTYSNVPLTGGAGSGAKATIVVSAAGDITSATIVTAGTGYAANDVLSVAGSAIGNAAGTGFGLKVATVGGSGAIATTTPLPKTYSNVPLTGGTGTGAKANITVNGAGVVTGATIVTAGSGYTANDTLSVAASSIGDGAGSGFGLKVATVVGGGATGAIATTTTLPVTYSAVPLTGGTGTGARANITVNAAGVVTSATISSFGAGYAVNDVLSVAASAIGDGAGTGFGLRVATVVGGGATGAIATTTTVPRTYSGVALTGGSGTGATANITVNAAGVVTGATLVNAGIGYLANDQLTAAASAIGDGAGTGFGLTVATVDGASGAIATTTPAPVTYSNVTLTGGSGTGATANITVNGAGVVTSVAINNAGTGYLANDQLTVAASAIGDGAGSGFELTVATVVGGTGAIATSATDKTYSNVTLTGGSGTGATADITVDINGEVTSATIANPGTGYTASDVLSVAGADIGNASGSGFSITAATVNSGLIATRAITTAGSGYANGTYTNVALTTATGSGTGARANITVSGGAVTSVTMVNAGTGYAAGDTLSVLDASIGSGGGSGFVLTASTVNTGVIDNTTHIAGTGYLQATGYVHAAAGTGYVHAAAGTGYVHAAVGSGYLHGITGAGYTSPTTYQDVPLTTVGAGVGTGATANITVNAAGVVTGLTIVNAGTGYVTGDVLSVSGSALGRVGSGFSVPVTASNGGISSLNLADMTVGTGYGATTHTNVELTGGSGTGARATITVAANGSVISARLTQRGNGYKEGDLLGAPKSIGINGTGFSIPVVSVATNRVGVLGQITPGSGYGAKTYSNIALTGGTGTGATANITVNATGDVTGATIVNPGTGYTANDALTIVTGAAIGNAAGTDFGLMVATVDGSSGAIATTTPKPVTYLNVDLTGGTGTGAKANITVDGAGVVTSATIVSAGTGYLANDILSVAGADIGNAAGTDFGLTVAVVTGLGEIATTLPKPVTYSDVALTGGSGTGATANITVSGAGIVTGVTMVNAGTGYAANDTLTLAAADIGLGAGTGFGLKVATVNAGAIATTTPLPVTYSAVPLTGGTGTGATANITVSGAGIVTSTTLVDAGIGYTANDILTVAGADIGNATGTGFGLTVATVGGTGDIATTTTVPRTYLGVALTGGSGTGATANITVDETGVITSATLVDAGTGYTANDVLGVAASTIGDGAGTGFGLKVATVGGLGAIATTTTVPRTYTSIPLTGGTGTGATAIITVNAAGLVTSATIANTGSGYTQGDVLDLSYGPGSIGDGAGSGFGLTVATVDGAGAVATTTTVPVTYSGVALTGGTGTGATADITVNAAGVVTSATLVNAGTGYTANDLLSVAASTIGDGAGSGFGLKVSTVSGLGEIGVTTTAPRTYSGVTLTGGTGTGARATITVDEAGVVTSVTIANAGTGYTANDTLSVAASSIGDGAGSGFELKVSTVSGAGAIATSTTDKTYSGVALTTLTGVGTGATADITVDINGVVTSATIVSAGTGYAAGDTLSVLGANIGNATGTGFVLTAPTVNSGLIATKAITTPGSGYANGTYTNVALTTATGSGTGARANITVSGGAVTSVTMVNAGTGYAAGDTLSVLDASIGSGGGLGFVLTASTVNTGVIATSSLTTAGSGYLQATGYVHANTGTGYVHAAAGSGYVHAATGTGYVHANTGTGYVHGFTGTGYVHGLTGTGYVHALTGTGYTHPLLFENVELTGGAGNGARADITVNSLGEVTSVNLVEGGYGYAADDVLTVSGAALGIEGAGFQVSIASLKSGIKSLQNITGVTSGGTGYIDGIYKDVPLTGGSGTGAKGTVEISNGVVNNVILTNGGSGYLTTDILSVNTSSVGGGIGSGFTTAIGSTNALQGSGAGTRGATYNLRLTDGTNLSITQVSESGNGTPKYVVNVDRFSVFATLDGNPVGTNSTDSGMSTIKVGGVLTDEQTSLGTMAFVGGKNLDSLSRDAFGKPQFDTRFTIDASGGKGTGWGQTTNGGVVQFTLNSTDMTAYSSSAQAYKNIQDGSATSQLASYSVDSSGQLVAQYDNGQSVVKGQLILAYFNNQEGLIPNGNNTFEASSVSGEPLLSFPGDGTLGSIRSKALEQSNVDLTSELVKLMVLQRQYSAVSQATKVMAATLIDDAINIGR